MEEEVKYTFEPYREDGSPRRFEGMFRPPFEEALAAGLLLPQFPAAYDLVGADRERWLRGVADRPLYEDD